MSNSGKQQRPREKRKQTPYAGRGPKGTAVAHEERLQQVAQLARRGLTQRKISEIVGVTQQQVGQDLKIVRKRFLDATVKERELLVAEKLEQYAEIRGEAYDAWEKSKENATKIVVVSVENVACASCNGSGKVGKVPCAKCGGKGSVKHEKVTRTVEGRLPCAEYLRLVEGTHKAERELLGLDEFAEEAAKNNGTNVNVGVGVNVAFSWDQMCGRSEVVDPVAEKLRQLEQLPNGLKELRDEQYPSEDGQGSDREVSSTDSGHLP